MLGLITQIIASDNRAATNDKYKLNFFFRHIGPSIGHIRTLYFNIACCWHKKLLGGLIRYTHSSYCFCRTQFLCWVFPHHTHPDRTEIVTQICNACALYRPTYKMQAYIPWTFYLDFRSCTWHLFANCDTFDSAFINEQVGIAFASPTPTWTSKLDYE